MSGQTPRGYIYATPDDPLVNWPATSQTLANAVDALEGESASLVHVDTRDPVNGQNIQRGLVNLTGNATDARTAQVTFATPFLSSPVIITQSLTGMSSADTTQHSWPSNINANGFQVNGIRNNSTDMVVQWIAFGDTA